MLVLVVFCLCAHLFIRKFGFRRLCMVAGTVAGVSVFISNWSYRLWNVLILLGFVPGLCLGQTMTSIFTINTRYFKKRLGFSTQILCLGLTFGALAACPIFQWLIDNYGWRGALLLIGGFYLNLTVVGATMRPIVLKEDFEEEQVQERKSSLSNLGEETHNQSEIYEMENAVEKSFPVVKSSLGKRIYQYLHLSIFLEPLFYAYAFSWVTFSMCYYTSLQYLVPFGTDGAGLTSMQSSSLVSALMVGELASRIAASIAFDRISTETKILVSAIKMLLLAATLFVVSFLRSYVPLLIGCAMLGVAGGGTEGIYCVFIADFFGSRIYAAVYGYGNIIIYGLVVVTTYAIGTCVDRSGLLVAAFYIGASSAFVPFLISIMMRRMYLKRLKSHET